MDYVPGRRTRRYLAKARALGALAACALMAGSSTAHAQDIEPRSYSNAPVGVNFLIAGYVYTAGGLAFDTALPVTDPDLKTSSAVLAYARVIDVWGMSGKIDAIVPYTWLSGTADLAHQPDPLLVGSGAQVLAGEENIQQAGDAYLIFRTSWVFGAHGANFAKTMLRLAAERQGLKVVADQFGAPTSAALIADVTAQVIGQYMQACRPASTDFPQFPFGLYHLVASGRTNWHEYAQAVVMAAQAVGKPLRMGPDDVQAITSAEYPLPAPRPANSCLDTKRLRETFGLCLPDWRQGLQHVLTQLL